MPKKKPGKKEGAPSLKKLLARRLAIHEASHAVAAWHDRRLPKVRKASIKRKEGSLGRVIIDWGWRNSSNANRETWLAVIRWGLASQAGEEICLGDHAAGVWGDLYQSTELAWMMEALYGMGKELGAASVMGLAFEPDLAKRINKAASKTVNAQYAVILKEMKPRKQEILKLAHALLERKTLKTKDLKKILGKRPKRIK
jgi:ATP-dependent Zn protease